MWCNNWKEVSHGTSLDSKKDRHKNKVPEYDVDVLNDGLKVKISIKKEPNQIPISIDKSGETLESQLVTLSKEKFEQIEAFNDAKNHFKRALNAIQGDVTLNTTGFNQWKLGPFQNSRNVKRKVKLENLTCATEMVDGNSDAL